jgi:hypothetical protein
MAEGSLTQTVAATEGDAVKFLCDATRDAADEVYLSDHHKKKPKCKPAKNATVADPASGFCTTYQAVQLMQMTTEA